MEFPPPAGIQAPIPPGRTRGRGHGDMGMRCDGGTSQNKAELCLHPMECPQRPNMLQPHGSGFIPHSTPWGPSALEEPGIPPRNNHSTTAGTMTRIYSTFLSWRMIPEQIPVLGGTGIPPKGTNPGIYSTSRSRGCPGCSPKADPSRTPGPGSKAGAASPPTAPGERNSRLQALGSLWLNGLDLFADLLQRPPVQHALPQHHERRRRRRHAQSGAHEAPEALSLQRGRAAAADTARGNEPSMPHPSPGNSRPHPPGIPRSTARRNAPFPGNSRPDHLPRFPRNFWS